MSFMSSGIFLSARNSLGFQIWNVSPTPMMRKKGQLDDLALYIGVGETFQIWNPKLFLADKNIPEDMKDIARFRLEERGL